MDARAEILARVRDALKTARLPRETPPAPPVFPLESLPPAEWVARFGEEARALGVVVFLEPTAEAVRARVQEQLKGQRVLSWPRTALPYGVGELLPEGTLFGGEPREQLAAATLGVTGADAAIAETGSLVLVSKDDHPRTASLLPARHLAILWRGCIVPTLGAALVRLRESIPSASCVNVITGPSRSADIELRLTLGVHGPGALSVVVGP
jgi:L-lactate dehydrogenase complex protein LldG